ncbi:AT-hook motif nuclear-localized protein 21-like [Oryza brachyantha]|uniref:AT-hook motif nuclear-localized protein 21-like n=1 Tax=Oryza brachyantha TaxID=4533 RepID=UPI001ADBB89D|nr:AT-hook motif nuclear-localized protein 21-like [Oryza brachyantha]
MGMVTASGAATVAPDKLRRPCRAAAAAALCPSKGRGQRPPPVVIAHECPSAMRALVVEVPAGRDVVSCVAAVARRARCGALVLGASGRAAHVVLREPALVLRGTMEILGLSGCFFPSPSPAAGAGAAAAAPGGAAAVFLAGPHGSVLGGAVAAGGLVAAGPVVVMLATFVAAAFDRLPLLKGEDSANADGCDVHGVTRRRRCGAQPPPPPQQQQKCGWELCQKLGAKS